MSGSSVRADPQLAHPPPAGSALRAGATVSRPSAVGSTFGASPSVRRPSAAASAIQASDPVAHMPARASAIRFGTPAALPSTEYSTVRASAPVAYPPARVSASRAAAPLPRLSPAAIEERKLALPITRYRDQIIKTMHESQVVILQGGTGSGKTTQLVQYILEEMKILASLGKRIPGLIACTQPRVIATMASARRVAQELDCNVSEEVGYRVRFDNNSSGRTRILFLTDGILVQELLADPLLTKYSFIILDEAHVRSVNLDFLLPMLRTTCHRRKDGYFRLFISSATIDTDRFADYLGAPGPISASLRIAAPIIQVDGQNFTVEIIYDASIYASVDSYQNDQAVRKRSRHALAAALKVKEIVERNEKGDILVFLPGQEEIEECCLDLHEALQAPLDIRPLFGALPPHQQNNVLKPTQTGRRKVVVATNIAETSLTIDGIVHVIDTGVSKEPRFDPKTGFHWIEEVQISKYSAIQRAGRAGRLAPGKCHRLYSTQSYDEMPTSDTAEITRADLAETMLQMSKLNVRDVPFMQKPDTSYFVRAIDDLVSMGAMDARRLTITPHGEKIMKLALEPCLANALIRSVEHGCSEEMLIIVAIISVDQAKHLREAAMQKRRELTSNTGDHLTLLIVYRKWTIDGRCGQQWCDDNFVYYQTMTNAKKLVDQIGGQMAPLGVHRRSCHSDYVPVQAALASCFADKAAYHCKGGVYAWLAHEAPQFDKKLKVVAHIDSDRSDPPKLVVCYKVVVSSATKKRQMQLVTAVEKHMLPESVRAKVPEDEPWTPADELMQAWLKSKNASTEAGARRESSTPDDDPW